MSSSAVFIADLHLEPRVTPAHKAFEDLLSELCARSPRPPLYILGDLFNYWSGGIAEWAPGHQRALAAIRTATGKGLAITLLHGNRDFLLDTGMKFRYGVREVGDSLSLDLGSATVYACHGDGLVIQDRGNMRFRWVVRSSWLWLLQELVPASWVRQVTALIRRVTRASKTKKDIRLFEVPPEVAARLLRGGHDTLICGHVHQQACRRLQLDGENKTFYTLGPWEKDASVLEFDGAAFFFRNVCFQ